MLQSIAALRSLRLLPTTRACKSSLTRALSSTPSGAEEPKGDNAEEAAKSTAAEEEQRQQRSAEGNEETVQPPTNVKVAVKFPPFFSNPKLESSDVVDPTVGSTFQQKRRSHVAALDGVTCTGWDGAPLRGGFSSGDWRAGENEEDDYKEYYKGQKPSPLSEVKFVDTRKPITRATDGRADDDVSDVGMGRMVEETVDEALLRAERMFREAATRGDPDSPQSRALARALARQRSASHVSVS